MFKARNPFQSVQKVQGASSTLRVGFSIRPHLDRAYLVTMHFDLILAVPSCELFCHAMGDMALGTIPKTQASN